MKLARKKLAYASPFRPQASGVSDYSEELLPYLARTFDITLVADNITPTNPALAAFAKIDLRELEARRKSFDAIVYHIGNAPLYANFYNTALRVPGIVVLHDVVLHHLRAWQTIERGDTASYVDALRMTYGEAVAERAAENLLAINRFEFPLSEESIRGARGVIVHSAYAARFAHSVAPHVPVAQAPMGIAPMPFVSPRRARAALNLAQDVFIVSAFGQIDPHKRISIALEAFAQFLVNHSNARLLLIGSVSPNYDVAPLIQGLGIEHAVQCAGFVTMENYQNYVAASDICLNLRYPSAGETSASLLRLLAAGKTTLVTRTAAYAELPDNVCVKIEPDAYEKNLLLEYLEYFAARPHARNMFGANARAYVQQHHTLEQAAQGYIDFLGEVA
ncbi:MAG: glycosyltransferase family 4 protein [Chloroflexi bacterium]|nr:glycosyltransferase family 4 protein [Chloroflexota bacterium]